MMRLGWLRRRTSRIALSVVAVSAALFAAPKVATALPIVLAPAVGAGNYQVNYYEPIGQSFTAEDPFVTAALYLNPLNGLESPDDPIQYDLFEGHGTGGALIASRQFVLAAGFSGFYDVDFSAVMLQVGRQYTLVASVVGESPYWGILGSLETYAGGSPFESGVGGVSVSEFALQVVPTTAPVPEPASLLLLGTGLIGAVRAVRRRRG